MPDDDTSGDDIGADPGGSRAGMRTAPPIIRAGCIALLVLGVLSAGLTSSSLIDPESVRCEVARSWIEDANEDDEDFNDVDTGGRDPDDLECDEAIRLADRIREDEDNQDRMSVPSESAIRTRGGLAAVMSIGQVISGLLTARTLSRRARTAALVFSAAGILFAVLGILSLGVLLFVVYALALSPASKAIWPPQGRRRRPASDPEPEE